MTSKQEATTLMVNLDENAFSARVLGPTNIPIECLFEEVDGGNLRVRFVPQEIGTYAINILKGDRTLSEFAHYVSSEHVGDKASFTINIEEHKKTYTATVTTPSNIQIGCTVDQSEAGNCMVRFVPKELGDHIIRIFTDNSSLPESEFIYNVTDLNSEVGYASDQQQIRVDEKADLLINEKHRPSKYTATITYAPNVQIHFNFEELDDGRCKIRFVPMDAGDYVIKIYKVASDTPIHEFTFTAKREHIREIATFTITMDQRKRKFSGTVTSPSNAEVECIIEDCEEDNYLITFVPREIGEYVIKLYQDETYKSQFIYTVVDRKASIPLPQQHGQLVFMVGDTIKLTFNIDGRLVMSHTTFSTTVTSPTGQNVNCTFQQLDDGNGKIRFVPVELGEHVIKIYKIGRDIPISQFSFHVERKHVNETASFTITINERQVNFTAIVISPSNKQVECIVEESEAEHCLIQFTPTELGNYSIQIFENNESVPVALLTYKIVNQTYDLSRKSPTENIFHVGEKIRVTINVLEAKEKISATVTSPSYAQIECHVEESDEGNCVVRFTPNETGDYVIRIFQGNNPIPVSQFTYKVENQSKTDTSGSLKPVYRVGDAAKFVIDVNDAKRREYSATVTSPSGEHLHCRVEESEEGSCRVRFIPKELGDYLIRLFQNDMQISQFTYKVSDLIKREPTNTVAYGTNLKDDIEGKYVYIKDQKFKLGEKVSFYLNSEQKERKFTASVTSPGHTLLDCDVIETSRDEFIIRFVPKSLGDHVIKLHMNRSSIPVYQFIYRVRGFIGKNVEFKVTSFALGPGKKAYKIMCPPMSKINYEDNKDGGVYEIKVRFNVNNEITKTTVGSGADKCTAEGLGLRRARVGEIASFKVNTSKARRGSLMVGVEGPKQPAKEIIVKHIGQQVYSIDYVLDMIGNYTLYVMWGGEHVPGSPFHVKV